MAKVLLLSGPEVIDVVSDVILIVFLIFGLFALIVFMVMALLLYRRISTLLETLTKAVERGDHLLEEIGDITSKLKNGRAIPGIAFRGAFGTLSALLGGVMGWRRRNDDASD